MSNSFIENVNYLASLDNNYGESITLSKTNLSLRNVANDVTLKFSYFNYNTKQIETITKGVQGMLYSGLETALQEFVLQIESALGGNKFDASYTISSANTGFLIHSFSINISSFDEKLKCTELNFNAKITSTQLEIYNLYGNVNNALKLLPTLALIDESSLNGLAILGESIQDIVDVSENIDDVIIVSDNIASVNNVNSNIEDVTNVSDNISSIDIVSSNIASVNSVSSDIDDVVVVSGNISTITNVNDNISDINTIGTNILNINNVALNMESVIIDANNIGNIVVVGNDLSEKGFSNLVDLGSISDPVEEEATGISLIETVANNITNVNLTGTNISDVNIVADDIDSVVTVSGSIANVNLVGGSISSVNILAPNVGNIDIVADNVSSVNSVASNIIDIQNAEENAQIAIDKAAEALASENMAEKWAENPEDTPVVGTVGIDDKYSAYHWAKKAEAAAGGSITIDSLYDVDTTGIVDGGIIRYDSATSTYKAYDFTNNDKIGFDLTAETIVSEGEMAWNADEGTADLGLPGGSVLQIGQENIRTVRNGTASTIPNGRLCMFDGTIGNSGRIRVKPFTAGFNEALYLYGIATQNIISGSDGIITIEGKARDIDTTGASVGEVWADGDILYAKPNDNGMMTNVEPADNELKLVVASVIHAHTSGTLEIRFMPFNENMYYTKAQNDILLDSKVPLNGDFTLDLGGIA